MRLIRKTLDEKFREIDNYLARKVMTPLLALTSDTGQRLEVIERSTYDTRDAIKRDSVQKFASMKDQVQEVQKTQAAIQEENKLFDKRIEALQENFNEHVERYTADKKHSDKNMKTLIDAVDRLEKLFKKRY